MAISYPRTLITTPGIQRNFWKLDFNDDVSESGISRVKKVNVRPGARFEGVYTLPPMTKAQADAWVAWFASMRGQAKFFFGFDPDRRTPGGIADAGSDTPLVNGTAVVGAVTIPTDGWRNNGTALLNPGDDFQFGTTTTSELKRCIEQLDSNGSGQATISFEPPIVRAPANDTPIVFENPVGVFRLSDSVGYDSNHIKVHGISFAVEERL